jgi:hypothetical protein
MNLREPMHPVLKSALIMLSSGIVASALCAKVYGATLPLDEPSTPPTVTTSTQNQASNDDAKAAATLRAMLMGQRQLLGTTSAPAVSASR